jgi:hypothetical protein
MIAAAPTAAAVVGCGRLAVRPPLLMLRATTLGRVPGALAVVGRGA